MGQAMACGRRVSGVDEFDEAPAVQMNLKFKQAPSTSVLAASWFGELDLVKKFVGMDPGCIHEHDWDGSTVLLLACYGGNLEVMQWLLQEGGASFEDRDHDGNTCLCLAARSGDLSVFRWLVSPDGGGVSYCGQRNHGGMTPLLLAARHGNLDLMEWMLSPDNAVLAGTVSLKEKDRTGSTALLLAAANGHTHVVRWLLQPASRLNRQDPEPEVVVEVVPEAQPEATQEGGQTASVVAVGQESEKDMQVLKEEQEDKKEEDVTEEFREGVKNELSGDKVLAGGLEGQRHGVRSLMTRHAVHVSDIEEADELRQTAVLRAVIGRHHETLHWLHDVGGASLAACDRKGRSALLLAANLGDLSAVQWLIRAGGCPPRDHDGHTALMCAAVMRHVEVVLWLVRNGHCDVHDRDNEGNTAFLLAAQENSHRITQFLLEEGGSCINDTNYLGMNCMDLSRGATKTWLLQNRARLGFLEDDERGLPPKAAGKVV